MDELDKGKYIDECIIEAINYFKKEKFKELCEFLDIHLEVSTDLIKWIIKNITSEVAVDLYIFCVYRFEYLFENWKYKKLYEFIFEFLNDNLVNDILDIIWLNEQEIQEFLNKYAKYKDRKVEKIERQLEKVLKYQDEGFWTWFELEQNLVWENFKKYIRLCKVFFEWKDHPESSFIDIYSSIVGKPLSDTREFPNCHESWNEIENWMNLDCNIKEEPPVGRDYCLFHILRKKESGFLSNFLMKHKDILCSWKNDLVYDLINSILDISFSNFCEQEDFYRNLLQTNSHIIYKDETADITFESIDNRCGFDFRKVKLLEPGSLTVEDFLRFTRNALSHWDLKYIFDGNNVSVYLKSSDFEVLIDPSFFDIGFYFSSYANFLPCNFIENHVSNIPDKTQYIYESILCKRENVSSPTNWSEIWERDISYLLNTSYHPQMINLSGTERINEVHLLNFFRKSIEFPILFWLVSDTDRMYVHNLFSAVSIIILNKIQENPNITYEMLKDMVWVMWRDLDLFTLDGWNKKLAIMKLCFDMLPYLIMLQWLKIFYNNILDIPKDNRDSREKRHAHIRNALCHWFYKIVWWKIILWDMNKHLPGSPMTLCKSIYDISDLFNEAMFEELKYHSRYNGFDEIKSKATHLSQQKNQATIDSYDSYEKSNPTWWNNSEYASFLRGSENFTLSIKARQKQIFGILGQDSLTHKKTTLKSCYKIYFT